MPLMHRGPPILYFGATYFSVSDVFIFVRLPSIERQRDHPEDEEPADKGALRN
jgi:hypothetical protein